MKGKRVVLVVDMLRGFHDMGNLANPRMAKIIPDVENLLNNALAYGDYAIFLKDFHKSDDKEFKMFPPHCIRGTMETELVDELKKFERYGLVINKTRYSGFYDTNLANVLNIYKPETVIVVGVCTDICVLHTVADLRNRDYSVIVPTDCVETFDIPGHPAEESAKWALNHMTKILGAVTVPLYKDLDQK